MAHKFYEVLEECSFFTTSDAEKFVREFKKTYMHQVLWEMTA